MPGGGTATQVGDVIVVTDSSGAVVQSIPISEVNASPGGTVGCTLGTTGNLGNGNGLVDNR